MRIENVYLIVLCFLGVFFGGCISLDPQKDPSRFYALNGGRANSLEEANYPSVGVWRVKVPEYLDRNEIATWCGGNEIKYAEFERWAEPVKDGIERSLAENLGSELGNESLRYPWPRNFEPDYRLFVEVEHFVALRDSGHVMLSAKWRLNQKDMVDGGEFYESTIYEGISKDGGEYAGIAAAMSRALARFAGEVAMVVKGEGMSFEVLEK